MDTSVAYCRVSTLYEEQQKSLEEQQKQWKELAKEKDYTLANCGAFYKKNGEKISEQGLYVDEGITAKDYKHREAFKQMIEDAKLGKFKTIFVEDVSRFSRNTELGMKICKDLREVGVGVYFRKEGINSIDVSNDFILQFAFTMAEKENQVRSERSKWGISRVHKDGRVNYTPPIGYKMKEGKVRGILEIDEQAAEVVKYIFYLYTDRLEGEHRIAQILNKRNIYTRKNKIWSQNTVRVVLENRIYIGEQRSHRSVSYDITRGSRKKIPEEEQIVFIKEELRIIDDETWNKKEMILNERRKKLKIEHMGHSTKHLLSALMYCANCGSVFFRSKQTTYIKKDGTKSGGNYEWVCMGRNHHGKDYCGGARYTIDDGEMIKFIKKELSRKQKQDNTRLLELYKQKKMTEINKIDINNLQNENKNINSQIIQIRTEKNEKLISEATYKEQLKELNRRLIDIKKQLKDYENIKKDIQRAELQFEQYNNTLEKLNKNKLTNADLKKIFNKILIHGFEDGKKKCIAVYFDYKFLDEFEAELKRENIDGESSITHWYKPFNY